MVDWKQDCCIVRLIYIIRQLCSLWATNCITPRCLTALNVRITAWREERVVATKVWLWVHIWVCTIVLRGHSRDLYQCAQENWAIVKCLFPRTTLWANMLTPEILMMSLTVWLLIIIALSNCFFLHICSIWNDYHEFLLFIILVV